MNANTNINVLGGILDAMLANLVEMIDKRVEAKHDEKMQTLWNDLSAANTRITTYGVSIVQLSERIERLETDLKAVEGQLYDLKDNTPQSDDLMEQQYRIKMFEKLEAHLSEERPGTTATLDQTEEFRHAVIKIINTHTMGDEFLNPLIDALIDCDTFSDKVKEIAADQVGSSIEDAMSDHCSDYEHEDIHETGDHEVDEDAVKDIIKEVLNNTTVTLKI